MVLGLAVGLIGLALLVLRGVGEPLETLEYRPAIFGGMLIDVHEHDEDGETVTSRPLHATTSDQLGQDR
jgi:hypothetical protein